MNRLAALLLGLSPFALVGQVPGTEKKPAGEGNPVPSSSASSPVAVLREYKDATLAFAFKAPRAWFAQDTGQRNAIKLVREADTFGVYAFESHDSREELADAELAGFRQMVEKQSSVKEVARETRAVDGVEALLVKLKVGTALGRPSQVAWLLAFTRQGICYALWGFHKGRDEKIFEERYEEIVATFRFTGQRQGWLKQYAGTPKTTALLGGLVELTLARPRWTEATYDVEEYLYLTERTSWRRLDGAAHLFVAAVPEQAAPERSLREALYRVAAKLTHTTEKPFTLKKDGDSLACLEVRGQEDGQPVVAWGTVLGNNEVTVPVVIVATRRAEQEARADWEAAVACLRLIGGATREPTYRLAVTGLERSRLAVARLLALAEPVLTGDQVALLHAVTPDGVLYLRGTSDRVLCYRPRTGARELLPVQLLDGRLAVSDDGKFVAVLSKFGMLLHDRSGKLLFTSESLMIGGAFHPKEQVLLLLENPLGARVLNREQTLLTSRLCQCSWAKRRVEPLVEFPLGRISQVAVSPDGTQLAFASNQDLPRTQTQGSNVYVADVAGRSPRRLTQGQEEVQGLCWSADGETLFALRQQGRNLEGRFEGFGPSDVFKLDPRTGQAINLTRCGCIDGVYREGDQLLLALAGPDLPREQRGLFRVRPADLEKGLADLPEPLIPASKDAMAVVEAHLKPLNVNLERPDLSPAKVAALAEAFVAAIAAARLERLDFSLPSLLGLHRCLVFLNARLDRQPQLLVAAGAYYGETLRRSLKGEWRLQPGPIDFGSAQYAANPFVLPAFPLREVVAMMEADPRGVRRLLEHYERASADRPLLLIHPASAQPAAIAAATPTSHAEVVALLDKGDVEPAFSLLAAELLKRPSNAHLADWLLSLAEAGNLKSQLDDLLPGLVTAGTKVPELLELHGDLLVKSEPPAALKSYTAALREGQFRADLLLKVAKLLRDQKEEALAEACIRRAYFLGDHAEKNRCRTWLGLPTLPDERQP